MTINNKALPTWGLESYISMCYRYILQMYCASKCHLDGYLFIFVGDRWWLSMLMLLPPLHTITTDDHAPFLMLFHPSIPHTCRWLLPSIQYLTLIILLSPRGKTNWLFSSFHTYLVKGAIQLEVIMDTGCRTGGGMIYMEQHCCNFKMG